MVESKELFYNKNSKYWENFILKVLEMKTAEFANPLVFEFTIWGSIL